MSNAVTPGASPPPPAAEPTVPPETQPAAKAPAGPATATPAAPGLARWRPGQSQGTAQPRPAGPTFTQPAKPSEPASPPAPAESNPATPPGPPATPRAPEKADTAAGQQAGNEDLMVSLEEEMAKLLGRASDK